MLWLALAGLGLAHAGDATMLDRDGDGIRNRDDACPKVAEDRDGWQDTDGCPEATQLVLSFTDEAGLRTDVTGIVGGVSLEGPGEYRVALLPGDHRLQVWAAGFEPFTAWVSVHDGAPKRQTVALRRSVDEVAAFAVTDALTLAR